MQLAMQPQLIAKYCGFLQAKELGTATIVNHLTQLKGTVDFIMSTAFRGDHMGWTAEQATTVKDWIAANVSQLKWQANTATIPSTQTLYQVWTHHIERWQKFKEAFKVG